MTTHPGRPFFSHPDFDPSLPPDNQTAPAPEVAAQQEPPAETTSAPEQRLYAGKYKTPEELEAGYQNSFRELERIRTGYDQQLAAERQRVDALIAGMRAPQQDVDPFAALAEAGIPPELIGNAVRSVARTIAREEARAAVEPLVNTSTAQGRMSQRYADFAQSVSEVSDGLIADPQALATYNRMFGVDPDAAMEWAYLRHRVSHPAASQRVSAADTPTEGAITSQRTPETRKEPSTNANAEEEARGLRYLRTYGDPKPYLRARFKEILPDSHFG